LPAGTLREELQVLFESYPERDPALRIKHFKIFERGRRCYFEGEDRTRSFLWQDSPFYSLPVFRHCMLVADRQKYYNNFCRQALLALWPKAASTPVTSSGHPPASLKYVLYHRVTESMLALPSPLVKALRFLNGTFPEPRYVVPQPFAAYLQRELSRSTPLSTLMDSEQVARSLRQIDPHSFFCFWTVAMLEKAYRSRMGHA
jgi:hypothetical protein